MKVLIGGGTGFVGRHLEKALRQRGHTVQLISRSKGADRVSWSELKEEQKLPECDALVNLSGEYILNPFRLWNASYKKDIYDSRIGTNQLLTDLVTKATTRPSVWVSAHAEGIYPRSHHKTYDDHYQPESKEGNYGQQLCYDWEKSAMLPSDVTDVRHVGVRIGLVLGRDGGFIQQSYLPFWLGLGGTVGSGDQKFPWIHIKDCANIFVHAIENDNMTGFYNAISPGQCNSSDFSRAFGAALNRPSFMWVPSFVIQLMTGRDRAPFILEGSRIKPSRTLESGFQFEFEDIEQAMVDIVNTK